MTHQDNFILATIDDPQLVERIDTGRRSLFARYAADCVEASGDQNFPIGKQNRRAHSGADDLRILKRRISRTVGI